jgi:hypothetical protein
MKNVHLIKTDKPSRLHLGKSGLVLCDLVFNPTTINGQNIYITNSEKPKARDWVLGDFPDNPIGKVISKYEQEFTAQSLNGNKHGLTEYDSKKIILTTDQDLIKDGVQAISDEFLQWFVKNPSCEKVEINYIQQPCTNCEWNYDSCPNAEECLKGNYKIIIPEEKPKNTCPKCRTTDFDTCHSIKCPMRKEEPINPNNQEVMFHKEHKETTLEEFAEKLARAFDNDNYKALMDLVIDGAKWQAERMYSEEEVKKIAEEVRWQAIGDPIEFTKNFNKWFLQFKKQRDEQ